MATERGMPKAAAKLSYGPVEIRDQVIRCYERHGSGV